MRLYALWLFLACLAAVMLGYATSTYLDEHRPPESAREPQTLDVQDRRN